jgi:hypothetical protein
VALGQVLYEYFLFPCQVPFHRLLCFHHLKSGTGTTGQAMADVGSGLSLTSPQETDITCLLRSQGSAVATATGYGLDDIEVGFRGPGTVKSFHFSTLSRPALGPMQPPSQWVPGALSPGLKRQEGEADHSPPTMPRSRKCGSIPTLPCMSSRHSAYK